MTTPEENLSFKIVGDYYYPRYSDGDTVISRRLGGCLSLYIGSESVAITKDGSTYVGKIREGTIEGRYDIEHFREPILRNVDIQSISKVLCILRA